MTSAISSAPISSTPGPGMPASLRQSQCTASATDCTAPYQHDNLTVNIWSRRQERRVGSR